MVGKKGFLNILKGEIFVPNVKNYHTKNDRTKAP